MKAVLDLSYGVEDTYAVRGECSNCGWKGTVRLPKGVRAPGWGTPAHCVDCGCRSVSKVSA